MRIHRSPGDLLTCESYQPIEWLFWVRRARRELNVHRRFCSIRDEPRCTGLVVLHYIVRRERTYDETVRENCPLA
jgi:hypothetical protein